MSLLDIIYPKRCVVCKTAGLYVCPACFGQIDFDTTGICLVCNRAAIEGMTHPKCLGKYTIDGAVASLAFNRVVKMLIYSFKYQPYIADIRRDLIALMYEGLIQKEVCMQLLQEKSILVPIPLHEARLRKRGYNQSLLLAKGLSEKFGLPVQDCLIRVKKTVTQVGKKREERYENIKDAFKMRKTANAALKDMQVMLIDDVVTSGATFSEAANVLKRHGVKRVYGIALARGQ